MTKKKFKISGMHCISCAMNIDGELEDIDGVKAANTNFAQAFVEVEYESDIDDEVIIKAIKSAGYEASLFD